MIALSRQMAVQRKLDVVANNIANMNTVGFKQERVQFAEFLKRPGFNEQLSMVQDRATVRDMTPGRLTATSNPLDLAINGTGYFVVDTVNGPHYSRDGRFQLNEQRQIVNLGGLPVLNQTGQPITVPDTAARIQVDSAGYVTTELNPNTPIGRINLVSFQNEQRMIHVGSGLFATTEQALPAPQETKIQQGMTEDSNVTPVVEINSMVEILRQYQQAQKLIDAEVERQKNVISRIGRVS